MAMTQEQREKKRASDKKYREAHREKIYAYHKEWRDKNRGRLNELQRERYKENPDAFNERTARYRASHQEKVAESNKRYRSANKQKRTDYERNKRNSDVVYRFRTSVRCLIGHYIKKHGYKGGKTTWEVIGCDFEALLSHIQSQFEDGMTLENYGNGVGKWSIDHIIPISTARTDEDIERLNHYTNLRPMWSIENSKPRKTP